MTATFQVLKPAVPWHACGSCVRLRSQCVWSGEATRAMSILLNLLVPLMSAALQVEVPKALEAWQDALPPELRRIATVLLEVGRCRMGTMLLAPAQVSCRQAEPAVQRACAATAPLLRHCILHFAGLSLQMKWDKDYVLHAASVALQLIGIAKQVRGPSYCCKAKNSPFAAWQALSLRALPLHRLAASRHVQRIRTSLSKQLISGCRCHPCPPPLQAGGPDGPGGRCEEEGQGG